jgi:parvulin-like peptidyl-prolyl isomerase
MQRWTALVLVALVAVAIGVVVFRTGTSPLPARAPSASASSAPPIAPTSKPALGPEPHLDLDAGLELDLGEVPSAIVDAGGQMLPNGQPAPALSGTVPAAVSFGAVLVEYRGAEGAQPGARSKEEALALAKQLASLAKTDFKAAVAQGDKGSGEDFGSIQRNILEPAPEFVLFSLGVGEVSDPVDSPRGFYVFKRIE